MSDEPVEAKEEVKEGAPAWVVTFGDLMSLLLCFFVLLLSFSETDKAMYRQVAGSMEKAFGVQRKERVMDSPMGIKMIAKDFDQVVLPTLPRQEIIATQDMDTIKDELKEEVDAYFKEEKDLISIKIEGDTIKISLMGETAFDSGKAKIRKKMIPLLKKIASVINKIKGDITIAGHTDNVSIRTRKFKSNLELSLARALSVSNFLIYKGSVKPERISTMGFGEYRPVATNDGFKGRRRNRRVEIILGSFPAFEHNNKEPLN